MGQRIESSSNDLGHMTKVAAIPMYGKNSYKSSPEPVN